MTGQYLGKAAAAGGSTQAGCGCWGKYPGRLRLLGEVIVRGCPQQAPVAPKS